jgi:hypothetical protein
MTNSATHEPTLAAELFGGGVGFRLRSHLRRWCGALLLGAAMLLLLRRADGALDHPPGFFTALAAMAAAAAVGALYRKLPPGEPWPGRDVALPIGMQRTLAYADCAACFLPTAAMLLFAAALSISGIRPLPLLTLWGAVVANEVAWLFVRRAETIAAIDVRLPPAPPRREAASVAPVEEVEPSAAAFESELPAEEPADDPALSQSWRRYVDDSGCDVFEGYVRAAFEAGSRQAAIHLAFCPPFERTPTLETEPLDELDLKLTHAVVLPYAARIDVRLAEPAEEGLRVMIGIRAAALPPSLSSP